MEPKGFDGRNPWIREAGMHKSRFGAFVIDVQADDLDAAAGFWSAALGKPMKEPHPDYPNYRRLQSRPDEPGMLVQKVDHPSRVHLDIETDNLDAEVARLEKLG